MLFTEALEKLQGGCFMARQAWSESGEYVCLMPGMATIWKIMVKPQPNAGNWLPFVSDLVADDWNVVDRGSCNLEQKSTPPSSEAAQAAA